MVCVYSARPVTLSRPSSRGTERPTCDPADGEVTLVSINTLRRAIAYKFEGPHVLFQRIRLSTKVKHARSSAAFTDNSRHLGASWTMANKDLRDWIDGVKAAGELKVINGRGPEGGDRRHRRHLHAQDGQPRGDVRRGARAIPKGHRVIANILTSIPRVNIALGLPPEATEMEQIQWWRNYFKNAPSHPTKAVNGGPLLDNVLSRARRSTSTRSRRRSGTRTTAGRSSAPPASW